MTILPSKLAMFCLLFLLFSGCKQYGEFDEVKESADVYSVTIEEAFSASSTGTLYISNKASTVENNVFGLYSGDFDKQIESLKEIYGPVDEEVLRSFLSKHQEPFTFSLETKLELTKPYEFLDGDQVADELKKPVLGGSPNKLPGSIIILSRVGFNSRYDKAFLKLEHVACPLCGFGAAYVLDKKDGKWAIKEKFIVWQS
ncbi:MAG: hypothetical protein KF685_04660 [Acidobacteria bacterium]|nr:hypothetical protein [Acidobacteriota bacterium]